MSGDSNSMREEAIRLRRVYEELKKQASERPEDAEIARRMQEVVQRYRHLQASSQQAEMRDQSPPATHRAEFDVGEFKPPPPVVSYQPRVEWSSLVQTLKNPQVYRTTIGIAALIIVLQFYVLLIVKDMRFFEVPSSSMEPTLLPGDRLVTLSASEYRRGQIVVYTDPADPEAYLVKRIVAVAGDSVAVLDGLLYINGIVIREPYIREPMEYRLGETYVQTGEVFVLGDNRNESEDSHQQGRGERIERIKGAVYGMYYPGHRRGRVQNWEHLFERAASPGSSV